MRDDGAYCDATFNGESAAVGIVFVENGQVMRVICAPVTVTSSHEAECAAIQLARELYPGATVFTDSASAGADMGATWIPREHNHHAHLAAHHGHTQHPDLLRYIDRIVDRAMVFAHRRRKGGWQGRGCVRREAEQEQPR
jgi:ribonuclease HI